MKIKARNINKLAFAFDVEMNSFYVVKWETIDEFNILQALL